MEPRSDSQRIPAGDVMAAGPLSDLSASFLDLQEKRREEGELEKKYKERHEIFVSLQQQTNQLHKEVKKVKEIHFNFDKFLKEEDADQVAEKAERKRKEVLRLVAAIERLKLEYAELMERKQELQHRTQKHSLYWEFMVEVLKLTRFDDLQALKGHLESLLHFRDHLYERANEAREQVDQQRNALLALEEQHHVLQLHHNNQLSRLQTKLEKTRSEALTWEKNWNRIEETAAKQTLLLGQIKMASFNLFEKTNGKVEGEENMDMTDTEKQLDKVKMFIQDHEDIVKQHQNHLQGHDGQKKDKTKPKKHL